LISSDFETCALAATFEKSTSWRLNFADLVPEASILDTTDTINPIHHGSNEPVELCNWRQGVVYGMEDLAKLEQSRETAQQKRTSDTWSISETLKMIAEEQIDE
jgi:hypothetical protein